MAPVLDVLTDRQERVLELSADGHSLEEIAARLGITYWTAKKHREQAVARIGAATLAQATAMYERARKRYRRPPTPRGQLGLDLG